MSRTKKPAQRAAAMSGYVAAAAAIAATGILVAGVILYFDVVGNTVARVQALYERNLESEEAAAVIGVVADQAATMAAITAAPEVAAALGGDADGGQRAGMAALIAGTHADIAALWLLPAGEEDAPEASGLPLSYTAREMIRRERDGQRNPPEFYPHLPTGTGYLVHAEAVRDDDAVLGVAVAYFSTDALRRDLARVLGDAGAVSLVQTLNNQQVEILRLGQPNPQDDHHEVSRANPLWRLDFDVQTAALPRPVSALALLLPLGLALLALALGLFVGFSRLFAALRQDAALLEARALGPVDGSFRLALFENLAASIGRSVVRPDKPRAMPPREGSPPKAAAGADAPQPLRKNFNVADLAEVEVIEDAAGDTALDEELSMDDSTAAIDPQIFRAYDIRGVVGADLTFEVTRLLGRALGSEAQERGKNTFIVGCDGRLSSPDLRRLMIEGLRETGCDVIDIGEVPTPLLYFATHTLESQSGVMITGSHNPPEYNGFKMVVTGETLAGDAIQALRERIVEGRFLKGSGELSEVDVIEPYLRRVTGDIVIAQPLRVVLDCGNGIAGKVAPQLVEALGCEVIPMYCEVDGNFPNHHPDPADPANMVELIERVKAEGADIGLAFDGDGDRLGIVTNTGEIIWPDRALMLFCRDIVGRNPGSDVIYDVKCSRHLNDVIANYGGRPIMWKTGHSHIKAKIKETGALIGGEFSGHICFLERWYGFDDGLYSAARLLEIVGAETATVAELFEEFPNPLSTPELKVKTTEAAKFTAMEKLAAGDFFGDASLTTIDGVRADYADGWGLIRASNTSPVLTLRFEADDAAALERIQGVFAAALEQVDAELTFQPFRVGA